MTEDEIRGATIIVIVCYLLHILYAMMAMSVADISAVQLETSHYEGYQVVRHAALCLLQGGQGGRWSRICPSSSWFPAGREDLLRRREVRE